jgi:uncharacterized protein YbcC (UPF0753/DUF2309 family)
VQEQLATLLIIGVLLLENLKLMHSELAKVLNSAGLTPAQCAIGFRTMTLLREQNIHADAAAQLIVDIYKKCKEFEITSSKFAVSIKEIKVSDDHHIQLHKIEQYIDEKITKKKELENELEDLKNEILTIKNQKSEIEMSETWPCSKRKWQI